MIFATPLAKFALKFGPPEYFGVIVLGLTLLMHLSHGSIIKALMMGTLGVILSCVGIDHIHGTPRMTFDFKKVSENPEFRKGIERMGDEPRFGGPEFVKEAIKQAEEVGVPILKELGLYVGK